MTFTEFVANFEWLCMGYKLHRFDRDRFLTLLRGLLAEYEGGDDAGT